MNSKVFKKIKKLKNFLIYSIKLGHQWGDKLKLLYLFIWWKLAWRVGGVFKLLRPPEIIQVNFNNRVFSLQIPNDVTFPHSFYEVFIDEDYRVDTSFAPNVILDVGANCGLASIYYSCLFPGAKIFALEPSSKNFYYLRINTHSFRNIQCVRAGLHSTTQKLKLFLNKNCLEHTVKNSHGKFEEIPVFSLSDFMDKFQIQFIDIFKIDAEGAEEDIFRAPAPTRSIGCFVGEFHPRYINFDQLITSLKKDFDIRITQKELPMIYGKNKHLEQANKVTEKREKMEGEIYVRN